MFCLQQTDIVVPWFSYSKHGTVAEFKTVVSMCFMHTHRIICFIVAQETGTWHTYRYAVKLFKGTVRNVQATRTVVMHNHSIIVLY